MVSLIINSSLSLFYSHDNLILENINRKYMIEFPRFEKKFIEDIYKVVLHNIKRENNYNKFVFSYGSTKFLNISPLFIESGIWKMNTKKKYYGNEWKSIKNFVEEQINQSNIPVREISRIIDTYFPDLIYIREAVIVLEDRVLWENLCDKEELTEEFKEWVNIKDNSSVWCQFRKKNWIQLDWFFPEYGLDLEHDGTKWHNRTCDNVRDQYIKEKYNNIRIERIIDFKNNSNNKKLELKNILSSLKNKLEKPIIFDFTDYVVKSFINSFITELTLINLWHYKKGVNFDELKDKINKYSCNYDDLLKLITLFKESV